MRNLKRIIATVLITTTLLTQFGNTALASGINGESISSTSSQIINEEAIINSENNLNKEITISLAPMGGSVKTPNKLVYVGETYGTLPTPIKDGYTFEGWYTAENEGDRITEISIVENSEPHTLYARWNPISSVIKFFSNGGSIDWNNKVVTYGDTYGKLPKPELAGYTFKGWYTSLDGGKKISENDTVDITSGLMLYAKWEGRRTVVSFDSNGGTPVDSIEVYSGDSYGELPKTQKNGYRFLGWYLHSTATNELITKDSIVSENENHTLVAHWSNSSVKVTFDANEGTLSEKQKDVFYNEKYGLLPIPTKKGYRFLGWNTSNGTRVKSDTICETENAHTLYAQWGNNDYKVTLDGNMAGVQSSSIDVIYGSPYGRLTIPELTNYEFLGWYTYPSSGNKIEENTKYNKTTDQTLFAHWQGQESTVIFDANGGKGGKDKITVHYGNMYGPLPVPSKTGYVFDGWYTSLNGTTKITENDNVYFTNDQTLFARWSPKVANITFSANGGKVIYDDELVSSYTKKIEYDEAYGELLTPQREGYHFVGWYTEATNGEKITANSVNKAITSDTIFAHWEGNIATVTFVTDSGSVYNTKNVEYGEKYGTLPQPEKANYTFVGWYTEAEGGTKVTETTLVKTLGNHKLYQRWKGVRSKVSFDNGLNTVTSAIYVYYGEKYGTLPKPALTGYEFGGWYTSAGNLVSEDSIVTITSDITLSAKWRTKSYKITFDANEGYVKTEEKTVSYGEHYGSLPIPSRNGYDFVGWFTSKTGTTEIVSSDTVGINADKTLYAHWKGREFTVYFNANGGTVAESSKTVTFGNVYGTLLNPTRSGHSFGGWYTKASGGIKVASNSKVDLAKNHTLYAHWTKDVYTVTFHSNGGKVIPTSTTVTKGTDFSDFPTPTKDGYTFLGWYSSLNANATRVYSVSAQKTIYAHWQGNTYKVSFDPCGGNVGTKSKNVVYKSTYGTLPEPTKAGVVFNGWYTQENGGVKVTATSTVSTMGDHILYARWVGIKSKLSYDSNGGTAVTTTRTITSGTKYGTLATTSRTGYDFEGWYTKAGELITADSIVTTKVDQVLVARWKVKTIDISFSANGGRVYENGLKVLKTTLHKKYGHEYGKLPIAVKEGHTFLGWFSGTTQIYPETTVTATSSITLYAKYQADTYRVKFDDSDCMLDERTKTVVYNEEYGELPTPTKTGCKFDGWFTEPIGGTQIKSTSKVTYQRNHTLYPHWSIATYKATFDFNGGVIVIEGEKDPIIIKKSSKTVSYGGTYAAKSGELPRPTRSGYVFAGYYTEQYGGKRIYKNSKLAVNEDQTLYAHWKPLNVTVTFDTNGGDPIEQHYKYLYESTYGFLPTPVRKGFNFIGWYTTKTGNVQVNPGDIFNKRTAYTVYARWESVDYTVTFDGNGGVTDVSQLSMKYNDTFNSLPIPERNGYYFTGWYTEKNGGICIQNGSKFEFDKNIVVYAGWKEDAYTVSFDPNGGTVDTKQKTVFCGMRYGTLPVPIKTGYNFVGWYNEEENGDPIYHSDYVVVKENQTLYAKWEPKEINVIFYANGGNLENPIKTVKYDKTYGKLPEPELTGNTFLGWSKYGSDEQVTENTVLKETDTVILKANWNEDTCLVHFDANGGLVDETERMVTYEQIYGKLPVPERNGFTFLGWYTKKEGGRIVKSDTKVTNAKDHTLYARWNAERLLVTFNANGGSCDLKEMEFTRGRELGALPVAVREGFRFEGWYTAPEAGEKITEKTILNSNTSITVYAHWTGATSKIQISFNPNGGTVAILTKEVEPGKKYGELPIPIYEGYDFMFWYINEDGINPITEETIVSLTSNHTLYAQWKKKDNKKRDKYAESMHFGEEGVDVATGNVSFSCVDETVKIPGFDFELARTYNSKSDSDFSFGKGWTFNFDGYIYADSDEFVAVLPNGSTPVFKFSDGKFHSKGIRADLKVDEKGIIELTLSDQSKYIFGADGWLTGIQDRFGNRSEIKRDEKGISSVTDPTGREYKITTDDDGHITAIKNPAGNEVTYTYNASKQLSTATNLLGGVTTYQYDNDGYLTNVIDPVGNELQRFSYDDEILEEDEPKKEITNCIKPDGSVVKYEYYPDEDITKVIIDEDRVWEYWYDDDMYIDTVISPDNRLSYTEYYKTNGENLYGDVKTARDDFGNITSFEIDKQGNVTKIVNPDKSEKEYKYDSKNNCIMEKNEIGTYTYYLYDNDGSRLLKTVKRLDGKEIDPDEKEALNKLKNITFADKDYVVEEYKYYTSEDAKKDFNCKLKGLIKSVTNAEGETKSYTYDSFGNPASETDAAGNTVTYTYDNMGNKLSMITAENNTFEWKYDANNSAIREYYPDGGVVVSKYNLAGQLEQNVSQVLYDSNLDVEGEYLGDNGTKYTYYPSGKTKSVCDALTNTLTYTYDSYGNVTSLSMDNGSIYSYEYDNRDRMTKEWYQENSESEKQLIKDVTYRVLEDSGLRTDTKEYLDYTKFVNSVVVTDNLGRETESYIETEDGCINYQKITYNPDGKKSSVEHADGSISKYKYDPFGNLKAEYIPDSLLNGKRYYIVKTYEYDRAGRKTKESVASEKVEEDGEDAEPPAKKYDTNYIYQNGQLTEETDARGGKTYYFYDGEGNVIRTVNGNKSENGRYIPDDATTVTETVCDFRGNPLQVKTLVKNGDFIDEAGNFVDALVESNTYDKAGRKISSTAADGIITTFAYDALGNQTESHTLKCNSDGEQIEIANTSRTYTKDGLLASVTDAIGSTTQFIYDNRGNLLKEIDPLGGCRYYQYDLLGNKVLEIEPLNYDEGKAVNEMARSEYQYDTAGRLKSQIDYYSSGAKEDPDATLTSSIIKTYEYDALGNITKEADAYGNGIKYSYYPNGKIASMQLATEQRDGGETTFYSYDVFGNLCEEAKGDYKKNYSYNELGMLTEVRDNYGLINGYTYDLLGRKTSETDGNGNTTEYGYNALGLVRSTSNAGDDSIPEAETNFVYDEMGRVAKVTDNSGNMTEYRYDPLGNVQYEVRTDISDGRALVRSFNYDENGNCVEKTDEAGNVIVTEYDALNRKVKETLADSNKSTSYEYDKNGNCTRITNYLGGTLDYVYDDRGRLIEEYDELGNLIGAYAYDNCGRQIETKDALGNTNRYTYDADGNLTGKIDANGEITRYSYDANHNKTSETDPLGNLIGYNYDGRNRLISVTDACGNTTKYSYDGADNLTLVEDPAGKQTTYIYNASNLLSSRINPGLERENYYYRADGKLSRRTDGNGVDVLSEYDGFGRLTSETASNSKGDVEVKSYVYDEVGNLLTMTDSSGVTERTYDSEGRVTSKTATGIGSVAYTYDIREENGEVSEEKITADGCVTKTTYDAAGRIKTVESGTNIGVEYLYNANGSKQSVSYKDGSKEEYTYDANGRPTLIVHTDRFGNVLDSYQYTYDAAGNLISEANSRGTTVYDYDNDYRILSVTEPDGRRTSYSYDGSGNRDHKTVVYEGLSADTEYTYDTSNHLISETDGSGNGFIYSYDAAGNQVLKEEFVNGESKENRYEYDLFNRLNYYSDGETSARYTYNAEDYRVGKQVNDVTGVSETRYFYEGDKVILETDESGNIKARNTYGTNLLSRKTITDEYQYLYNVHGDVVMLLDAENGNVAKKYVYDAFGNIISQEGDADNQILYAGYQYDPETELYYVNARYYDSSSARFLTEDTYSGKISDPLSLNRYTYCHNSPIRYYDPSGHSIIGTILLGAAGGAIIGGGFELFDQIVIQKREKIDWKAVGYEAGVGAISGAIGGFTGGTGSAVVRQGGKIIVKETAKNITKRVIRAGVTEGLAGAAEDVGRQMIVEGKSLKEVDYGQAMKTGAISGLSGAGGELFGSLNEVRKASSRKIRKAATKEIKKDAGEELSERLTKNSDKNLAKKAKEIKSISSGAGAISDKGSKNIGSTFKSVAKNNLDDFDSLPKGSIQSIKSGIDADDYVKKTAKNADVLNGSKIVGKGGRNSAGVVTGGENLSNAKRMMHGSQGNVGIIPKEIADKMRGRQYSKFDAFREDFWKTVADSSYASEFSNSNIGRMRNGYAPRVIEEQRYGGIKSYILHHKTPIHDGGGVFDLDNIAIVAPRMHQEILDKTYHFGH